MIKTMLCMLVAPPIAWMFWFVFCTPISAKVGVYIFIGPGCEFGFHTSVRQFYWCPFGFIAVMFQRENEGAE